MRISRIFAQIPNSHPAPPPLSSLHYILLLLLCTKEQLLLGFNESFIMRNFANFHANPKFSSSASPTYFTISYSLKKLLLRYIRNKINKILRISAQIQNFRLPFILKPFFKCASASNHGTRKIKVQALNASKITPRPHPPYIHTLTYGS
jgi:hypothetical protein